LCIYRAGIEENHLRIENNKGKRDPVARAVARHLEIFRELLKFLSPMTFKYYSLLL